MTKHSHSPHTRTYSSTPHNANTTSITLSTQTHNILQHSKAKQPTIFNNGRYTTNIPTYPQTVTTSDIKQTCAIYMHLLSLGILPPEAITKYCAHLLHTLAALKRNFPASLVAPLPNTEQTNLPSSYHTYTKSTPKHIHLHYAPSVTSTHTTHIISSTAPTYAPH